MESVVPQNDLIGTSDVAELKSHATRLIPHKKHLSASPNPPADTVKTPLSYARYSSESLHSTHSLPETNSELIHSSQQIMHRKSKTMDPDLQLDFIRSLKGRLPPTLIENPPAKIKMDNTKSTSLSKSLLSLRHSISIPNSKSQSIYNVQENIKIKEGDDRELNTGKLEKAQRSMSETEATPQMQNLLRNSEERPSSGKSSVRDRPESGRSGERDRPSSSNRRTKELKKLFSELPESEQYIDGMYFIFYHYFYSCSNRNKSGNRIFLRPTGGNHGSGQNLSIVDHGSFQ
jgi:hypothetical protein